MRRFNLGFARRPRKALLVGLVVAVASLFFGVSAPAVHASGCEPSNDIMLCGFSSSSNFINKVRANNDNGHQDLIPIYSAYGLERADYDKFVTKAVPGLAYKDNTLRLRDGTIVARNVDSIGRNASFQGSGYFTQIIAGNKYFGNTNDKAFASGPLAATILMDGQGHVQFAVLDSCGNPIGAPNYRCNTLHVTSTDKPNVFKFSSDVTANSTAKVKKVVYDFGDGSTDTETDPTKVVTHVYAERTDSYQAKVKVFISLPHADDVVIPAGGDCVKKVVVNMPPKPQYACVDLSREPIDNSAFRYHFVAKGTASNGATIHSATFKFGDGNSRTVLANGSDRISTDYRYDPNKEATYKASVTLNIDLPGGKSDKVTSSNCQKIPVPVNTPFYACKSFTGTPPADETTHLFSFTVVADYNKYVSFSNVQFDFGDGTPKQTVAKGADGFTETTTHKFVVLQNYTVTATLNFKIKDQHNKVVNASCTVSVTPTGVVVCQPGDVTSPTGAPCHPCATNPAVPVGSPQCTLPNTGAGEVIGITGVAAVLGFFLYRQFIYRKHALSTAGGAMTFHQGPPAPDDDDNEIAAQVITHHTHAQHRNKQGLHHTSYHKPHRFRPRSHHKKDN